MHLDASRRIRSPGRELRHLLATGELPLYGGWGACAHHAQLAQAAGFHFFGLSGSNTSTHLLGLPDAGLLTLSELVENVRRICATVSIPVIVDCDTGFGNAINVVRTTSEVIRAGLLEIERQFLPPASMERYSQSLGAYDPRGQPSSSEQSAAGKMERDR